MTAVGLVALLGLLGGCAGEKADAPGTSVKAKATGPATAPPAKAPGPAPAAKKGGTVGPKGSACVLPATFDIAEKWTAGAVEVPFAQGPVSLACEIDAKPAGHIGFLRVWTGGTADDDPREALEAFTAEESPDSEDATYSEIPVGPYQAVEVAYLENSELNDSPQKRRSLAFATADGLVVMHLGGMDTAEHEAMLPAFELAKKSVRAES
ncbi:lipoprotein [Streptomyces sp. NBC_01498]|uniref:lipoprotein n=1 Tax=Streptomyces sp. NBC_01498 TaxID=2975870 RepID=UPI002E7B95A7|nr:lipoprotein [Streptomyces sp. NBC_01498]WTL25009.1 lipoprotein [Streptomyces sp. NBC_01498]